MLVRKKSFELRKLPYPIFAFIIFKSNLNENACFAFFKYLCLYYGEFSHIVSPFHKGMQNGKLLRPEGLAIRRISKTISDESI